MKQRKDVRRAARAEIIEAIDHALRMHRCPTCGGGWSNDDRSMLVGAKRILADAWKAEDARRKAGRAK